MSILGHPFVMALLLAVVAGWHAGGLRGWTAALVSLLPILPVAWLMRRQVRRGEWQHVDASRRSERPILFVVAGGALLLVLAWAWWREPGSYLVRGLAGGIGLLLACALANRWTKVSLHMAFATMTAAVLVLLPSWAGVVVAIALPAIAWSRLHLQRHSPAEVAIGTVFGALAGVGIHAM